MTSTFKSNTLPMHRDFVSKQIMETIYSIRLSYDTPTIPNEKNFAYVESSKFSMLVGHEKNALGDFYIVEFIHDATKNYYEGGIYACRNCNNIKFPLSMCVESFEVILVLPSYAN